MLNCEYDQLLFPAAIFVHCLSNISRNTEQNQQLQPQYNLNTYNKRNNVYDSVYGTATSILFCFPIVSSLILRISWFIDINEQLLTELAGDLHFTVCNKVARSQLVIFLEWIRLDISLQQVIINPS